MKSAYDSSLGSETPYQRARTDGQRIHRTNAILAATRDMLDEMPFHQVSLNGIARRTHLSTSNILRYFDSREAIFLHIINDEAKLLLDDLFDKKIDPAEPLVVRLQTTANLLTENMGRHPRFCRLLNSLASILQHHVSEETTIKYKEASFKLLHCFSSWLTVALPEVGDASDTKVLRLGVSLYLIATALWSESRLSEKIANYVVDHSEVAELNKNFVQVGEEALFLLLRGASLPE